MCGLAGFWSRDGVPAERAPLDAMLDRIAHRGPDGRGTHIDGDFAVGHVRLSILDLDARAGQPFHAVDGGSLLAYNGEVYNYPDLRRELEAEGARFATTSDTEVILEALRRWGPERAVPRFNGMFAFAWFDRRERTLWLARDRLGIKPLYVAVQGRRIGFASEEKALLVHPALSFEPDTRALLSFLVHLRFREHRTPWRTMEALAPGSLWKITAGGIERRRWFDVVGAIDVDRLLRGEDPGRFPALLEESVRLHLASDAPLATTISGGLDSALVSAAARRLKPDIIGYVANVPGEEAEGERAARVAGHLGIPLRPIEVVRSDFLRLWPSAVWFNDEPDFMASAGPLLRLSRAARADGFKVLLTGEGSDELFGGYVWYPSTWRSWKRVRRRVGSERGDLRLRDIGIGPIAIPGNGALRRRIGAALDAEGFLRIESLLDHLAPVRPLEDRAMLVQALDDLQDLLLALMQRNDRTGMAAGLEIRVPFIENAIIDYALHLPRRAKVRGKKTKVTVRRAARRVLPREVVNWPKRGFPIPGAFRQGAERLLEMVPQMLGAAVREIAPLDDRVRFALVSMELWARMFLRGESPDELGERLAREAGKTQ